jgi:hypothetical protein
LFLGLPRANLDFPLASSNFISSSFLDFVRPSSNLSALRIYNVSYSNFHHPYIDLSPASSAFFCLSRACSIFFNLQIYSFCSICSLTFDSRFIMMALMGEPWEIDCHCEKGRLALYRRRSRQEVQTQKGELTARIDEGIQRFPTSGGGSILPGRPSSTRSIAESWEATEVGRMLKRLADE